MNVEKASSLSSSYEYETVSNENTPRTADPQIDTQATYDEFFKSSNVFVDEEPKISKTTISSNGLSTCIFFLMDFHLGDDLYCLLIHHEKLCNPKMSAPNLLVHLLDGIIDHTKNLLLEEFRAQQRQFNFLAIKNITLIVGGGTPKEHDNIKKAFGLLVDRNESVSKIMLDLLRLDEECQYLMENLVNKTKIFSATSYLQSRAELNKQRKNPNEINSIIPPDLWLLYNCQTKECVLGVRWDGKSHHIDLALMIIDISKLQDVNQYKWHHQINQIEILKNNLANESGVSEKLQKALLCINPDALYVVPPVLELIDYYRQRIPFKDDIDKCSDDDNDECSDDGNNECNDEVDDEHTNN